jgi:hypothetical protein
VARTWSGASRGSYDLSDVEITARDRDCSVWGAPCCGQTVDDRVDTGSRPVKD